MQTNTVKLEFDPGFAPYIMAFQGTIEYIYSDINRFKNFSQKKIKFMQYHKKILEVFFNNIGFYTGCLMWAAYLKEQPKGEIVSNGFLGLEYNEEENIADVDYLIKFTELFPKDMKYFLGQTFTFEDNVLKLLNSYKEFLIINKGFTTTKYNTDLELPSTVKTFEIDKFKKLIDKAIDNGNLNSLFDSVTAVLN